MGHGALVMSPRSVGEQTGILHQMVETVLSSSPQSVNTRDLKYVNRKIGVMAVFTFLDENRQAV